MCTRTTSGGDEFSKFHRLTRAEEFKRVFQHAKKIRCAHFTLYVCQNDLQNPRLGLAVSKKTARLSVERNRIKRLARESFRHEKSRLPAVDIIFLARHGIANASNHDIMRALSQALRGLGKRCEKS